MKKRKETNRRDYVEFGNGYTSINLPNFGEGKGPRISSADYAFRKGEKNASKYSEELLLDLLRSKDYEEIYEAFGAIGKRKYKKALPNLKNIVLYDEDQAIQKDAIRTIRRIGGRTAVDILRFLKSTEHKEFIEKILEVKDPGDVID